MTGFSIDLNCDMGESFGAFKIGNDEAIMPFISSANIACGFHAGDPGIMKKTVQMAIKHGVAIGAHPGLPDLQGFGRRNMNITAAEAYDLVVYQIGALNAITHAEGGILKHVKPHGALYNMAAKDTALAEAIAEAVLAVSPQLILYGLADSELIAASKRIGLPSAREVFADRTYQSDGTLTPRDQAGAVIVDADLAVEQVMRMIASGSADTICLHGDGLHAVGFVRAIYAALQEKQIGIQPPHQSSQ